MTGDRTRVSGAISSLRFRGGYRFRRFEGAPTDDLTTIEPGSRVAIPLAVADGVTVANNDTVSVGQIIRESDGTVPSVSSVAGTVAAVTEEAIHIDCAGDQNWAPVSGWTSGWEHLAVEAMRELVVSSGSWGVEAPESVQHVVVHDAASEVYRASSAVLMEGREPAQLADGARILRTIYPNADVHVVMNAASAPLLREITGSGDSRVHAHVGSPKYPQHNTAVLLGSLFNTDPGAPDRGAASVVMDLQAFLQIRDAVVTGKPNIERILPLGGAGFSSNPHVRVRVGTPVDRIVDGFLDAARSPRIVFNSVMTGRQVEDLSAGVDPACTALIAVPKSKPEFVPFASPGFRRDSFSFTFLASVMPLAKTLDDNIHGERRACVACGYCEDVCPVGILPYDLHRYVERNLIDEKLLRYGALRCIDCNLCSYVCPSKIPLARLIADGKKALLDEGFVSSPPTELKEDAE